jgi:hypothetical protein
LISPVLGSYRPSRPREEFTYQIVPSRDVESPHGGPGPG